MRWLVPLVLLAGCAVERVDVNIPVTAPPAAPEPVEDGPATCEFQREFLDAPSTPATIADASALDRTCQYLADTYVGKTVVLQHAQFEGLPVQTDVATCDDTCACTIRATVQFTKDGCDIVIGLSVSVQGSWQ